MLLCCYELYDYMSYVRRWTSKQPAKLNWIVQEARLALANPTLPVMWWCQAHTAPANVGCPGQFAGHTTTHYTLHTTTPHHTGMSNLWGQWSGFINIAPLRPCNWHIFQETTDCIIWEAENLSTLPLSVYVCHQMQPDIGFQATNCVFLSLRSWTVI